MLQHFLRSRCFRSFAPWASPGARGIFPQAHFVSLARLYLVLFASVFMSSLDLAYYSFVAKAPNHAANGWPPWWLLTFYEIPPSTPSGAPLRQPSLILCLVRP